jgi:hypothetical protein
MSNCLVTYNGNGNIVSVSTPSGEKSKLFDAIHSNIFLGSSNDSYEIFKNAYSDNAEELFKNATNNVYDTKEPKIFYKSSNGVEYDDLEDLILSNELGTTAIGFKNPSSNEFMPIATFNTDSSVKTKFLASQVQIGLLSSKRVLTSNGETFYQGKGQYEESRKASARGVAFEARVELAKGNISISYDGLIDLKFDDDHFSTLTKDGEGLLHFSEALKKGSQFENKIELISAATIIDRVNKELNPEKKSISEKEKEALKDSLYSFLNSMGFSLSTLEEYRNRFNTVYGKDPDISAIADMANKVVAISEDQDITKELLEEVAHIAIESYSEQNSITSALALVHLTPEYTQFAEAYREKYSQFSEGLELEEKVRKEILGKILAKTISERFNKEGKSEEHKTILDKLKSIWDNFVNFLKGNYGSYEKQTIDSLNETLADAVLNGKEVFNKDFESDNFFYDLTDKESKKLISELKKARTAINALYGTVLKQASPDSSALEKIVDDMKENDVLTSISAIKGITSTLLNKVSNGIKTANKNGTTITQQDSNIFNSITENSIPSLENLRTMLEALPMESEASQNIKEQLLRGIDDTILQHSKLRPLVDQDYSKKVNELVEEALNNSALTEDERDALRARMDSDLADIGMLAKWFGLASQNKNLFVQLMHQKAVQMGINTTIKLKQEGDKILRDISEKGLEKYQKSIIKKHNNKSSYYYLSPINQSLYDEDYLNTQIELIKKHSGREEEAIRRALKNGVKPAQLIKSEQSQKDYLTDLKKARESMTEQSRTKQYYEERDRKYAEANVSEYTQEVMAIISRDRSKVVANARTKDGFVDRTKMSDSDKFEENAINLRYKLHRSPFDQNGSVKPGLKLLKRSEMTQAQFDALPFKDAIPLEDDSTFVVLEDGMTADMLADDARVSYDMNNLSMTYKFDLKNEARSTEAVDSFLKELTDIEATGGNSFDWLQSNSSISLNEDFYNQGKDGKTYEQTAQEFVNTIEDDVLRQQNQNVLDRIKDLQASKSGILKQHRNNKNSLEINAQNIEPLTKARLLEIENEIDLNKSYLDIPFEASEDERTSIKVTNSAYENDLTEFGTNRRLQFALQHVPNSRQGKITTFSRAINNLLNGGTRFTTDYYESRIQKAIDEGQISNQMLEDFRNGDLKVREQIKEILVYDYAKENVASYYQRFEPIGYSEFMTALEDGTIPASQLLTDKASVESMYPAAKFVEVNPDYTWLKDVGKDDFKNDKYITEGQFIQPNISKYADKEFFDKYGINMKQWMDNPTMNLDELEATKNKEEFEFLRLMVGINKSVSEMYGESQALNPFQRPQLSKTVLEDLQRLDVKDFFREIVKNRIDDKDYGEQIEGQNLTDLGVKVLPKYFQTKLEQPNSATEHTIHAAMLNLKQAILYKERQKAEGDFKALEFAIANQTFQTTGGVLAKRKIEVKGQTSEYLKYAREYIGHHLYGVRQTRSMHATIGGREYDMTRVVNKVQSFVRFSNLAFNPFVDAVSATTGVLNNLSDRVSADYYHKSSANKAMSQLLSLMPDYLTETGKMNKSSVLNHLVEFYGLQDFDSKVKDSAYARAIRMGTSSAYKMSKLANIPVGPRSLLAVLNDYRYVDGKFVNWDQFLKLRRNSDKSIARAVVEAEWAKYSDDSLYENIKVDKTGITFNDKFKSKFENPEKEFENLNVIISQRAISLAQMADGVINEYDQVAAQRDVLTNTLMMHRGWLPILLTKRFKSKRYNVSMGRMEEGHFTTLFRFMGDAIKSLKGGKPIKEVFADMEQYERNNIKRSTFETALWIGLLLLGEAILAADDDDDSYFEDFMQYIYVRTVSEFSSQQVLGIPGTLVDVVKNPVVPIRTLEAMEPVQILGNLATGDFAEIGEKFRKNTILKRGSQLTDIQKQLDSYRFFNQSTLYNLAPDTKKDK